MSYSQKKDVSNVNDVLPTDAVFICFASFEDRCCTLSQNINTDEVKKAFVFRNIDPVMKDYNYANFERICNRFSNISSVEVNLEHPVMLADKVFCTIREIKNSNYKNIVIDISTFTHEALLILLRACFDQRDSFDSIMLVYNGAREYLPWLSMGCKTIRNVVGFPGLLEPGNKNHLIVMTGFEKERTTKLVEQFEPDELSIGFGYQPTDFKHIPTMKKMEDEYTKWFNNIRPEYTRFSFSCSEIESTMEVTSKIIEEGKNENIILVPLNTKLSTISIALLALKNDRIQIVYPVPETYNLQYSIPSNNFTVIDFKQLIKDNFWMR